MPSKTVISFLKSPALLVFLLTLIIRLLVISRLTESPWFTPDQGDMKFYNDWALRILRGEWTDGHAFYGLPGYPFLMAGIYGLLGYNPLFLSILQALCEAFISLLIFKIADLIFKSAEKPLFGPATGILAASGYALFVPAQTFSVILMPTSLLVCVFWAVVWWSARERESAPGWLEVAGLGFLVGITALVVATIFFVIPILLACLVLRRNQAALWTIPGKAVVLFLGIILGCSPAMLHNRLVAKDPVFLSAHSGLNFFVGNNATANGYPKIPAGLRAGQAGMLRDSITIAEAALGGTPGQPIKRSAVSAYWSAKASDYIRQHRLDWLKLEGRKILNFWNAYQYDDLSLITPFASGGITTPGLRFELVSALGLAGILSSLWRFPRSRWIAAAVFLHMGSLLTVFITERYRLAAVPGLLIFGAFLLVRLWDAVVGSHWKTVGLLTGLTIGSSFFVALPPADQGVWALDAYNSSLQDLRTGHLAEAEKKLQLAWRHSSGNSEVNFALGNLYLEKKDNQRAKEFYRRTLEINPRHDGALNNLGWIALEQKMPATAIQFFANSLAVEPEDAKTTYLLALAYLENQQPAEAGAAIKKALRLRPGTHEFLELQKKVRSQIPPP